MTRAPGPGAGVREVLVTELELTSPDQLRPTPPPPRAPDLVRAESPAPELSRFFYRAVGGDWYWLDRLDWTLAQWDEWVRLPGHALWTCWLDGAPVGYVELQPDAPGSVEIAYFGLLPAYVGRGLGGWLLTQAVERAWDVPGTTRVWLHTCELDSPAALPNYRARGFVTCGTSVEYWDTSDPSPGPWRGAR